MKRKMKSGVRLCFLIFLLLEAMWCCEGCWKEEREALLGLNTRFHCDFPSNVETDCCEWEGVECNSSTGRVAQLYLYDSRWPSTEQYINYSDFSVFKDLKELSLSDSNIVGCVEGQELPNLEILDMIYNNLDTTAGILSCLEGLPSLKSLYLKYNSFGKSSFKHVFETLLQKLHNNLEVLGISENNFTILAASEGFTSLKQFYLTDNQLDSDLNIEENETFKWPTNLQYLSLRNNRLSNRFVSSLRGLPHLQFLDLSYNQLKGALDISGLLTLSSLTNLDLSHNGIQNLVAHEDSKSLSKLDVLDLDENMIDGTKLRESLRALSSSIREISMSYNYFNGTIIAGDFHDLSNLEDLRLDGNTITDNEFFKNIGNLTSLKILSVSDCYINDILPPTDWFRLKNLEELYLSHNLFVGSLPASFLNMTSLQMLELSQNQFNGQFDSNIASFTSLEYFGFTQNQFEVPISFTPFANHSNLKFIYGEGNKFILDLQPSLQTWIPKFQLQVLSLPSMTKNVSLPLPRFLLYQKNLSELDFSSCRLEGVFPHWLLENNTKLTKLYVRNCSFTGTMQLPLHPLLYLQDIDMSDNNIIGEIPSKNISSIYPNLKYLNMSRNHIQGSIPFELGRMKLLNTLDLSNNKLSREIPRDIFEDGHQLYSLDISNNKLEGPIFSTLTNLKFLSLNDNKFSGRLSSNIFNTSIISLDVSNNHLVGKIPSLLKKNSALSELRMSNNHFEGFIPLELTQLKDLSYLDLSQNNLFGLVPSFLNSSSIKFIHLSNNHFTGLSKKMFKENSPLVMLDLSYNEISSNIQDMIQDLSHSKLNFLLLKGNYIVGDVPKKLCQLIYLTMLDLSDNNFFWRNSSLLGQNAF